MKSPPTDPHPHPSVSTSSTSTSTMPSTSSASRLSSSLIPNTSSTPSTSLRLPECVKRTVVGCAIALSALQHASLLLSIELSSSSSFLSTSCPLSFALGLLLASTAVSACTLGFLVHTKRLWPSLLAFVIHIDLLALTLAFRYGIASEFLIWLAWVPVLFFLVGAPRCAMAALYSLFLQGFLVHYSVAWSSPSMPSVGTLELTPGAKLVCCGMGLMAVGVVARLLHTSPPREIPDPGAHFLAHIGSEIKAPLHGILSLAEQVVDSLPNRLWIERECVRRIVDSGHAMVCVIDNVLDFPALSASQLSLQTVPFSIVDEFNQVLSILKPSAFKKQITLESTIDVLYPERFGDPKRFRQVLFNVASNAIKFTPEKGSVRLFLSNSPNHRNRIDVRVEDTGLGVPPQLLPHLFELRHVDQVVKKDLLCGGPGLGLAVSKLLCEAMNGRLECQSSQPGKGSTFCFSVDIPVHEDVEQKPHRSKSADSLSHRRNSEGGAVGVDNNLPASPDRLWVRRHSLASTHTISAPRKRRPSIAQPAPQSQRQPRQRRSRNKSDPPAREDGGVDKNNNTNKGKLDHDTTPGVKEETSEVPLGHCMGDDVAAAAAVEANEKASTDRAKTGGRRKSGTCTIARASSYHGCGVDTTTTCLVGRYQSLQGTRVLLVEDNLINQKVAKLMLSSLGCEVAIAGNGQIGLSMVEERPRGDEFDIILMDLQMPVMDGFLAATKIRERERLGNLPRTPIVTLTASTTSEYRERCVACGMDGWLSKPFSKEQLAAVISAWKRKRPSLTSTRSASPPSSPPASSQFSTTSDDGSDPVALLHAPEVGDEKACVDINAADKTHQRHDERLSLHRSTSG